MKKSHFLLTSLIALFAAFDARPQCSTTSPPEAVFPSDQTVTVSPVEFRWTELDSARDYRVYVRPGQGKVVEIGTTADDSLTEALPAGEYSWFVVARVEGCDELRSESAAFRITERTDCPTVSPRFIFPRQGTEISSGRTTFVWEAVPEAVAYVVLLRPEHGRPIALPITRQTRATTFLTPGSYYWSVEPVISGCSLSPPRPEKFTVTVPEQCRGIREPVILGPERGASSPTTVEISWSQVPEAEAYGVVGISADGDERLVQTTTETRLIREFQPGFHAFLVSAIVDGCPPVRSEPSFFRAVPPSGCDLEQTSVRTYRKVISGKPYGVHWRPLLNAVAYEIQESVSSEFEEPVTSIETQRLAHPFQHVVDVSQPYHYRVRGISGCGDRGPWSNVARIVVANKTESADAAAIDHSSPADDAAPIEHEVFISNDTGVEQTFSVTADVPWLEIEPSNGTLPPEGATVLVRATHDGLDLGSNSATLTIDRSEQGSALRASNSDSQTVPVSMSLVVPVSPTSADLPPDNALIVPGVAHAEGFNSQWQSDVRIANVNAATGSWEVRYSQTAASGTLSVEEATVSLSPGDTLALNDVLESFYGVGALQESELGALEIRPASSSNDDHLTAIVTTRTYNLSASDGTFGQFLPAVRFADFLGSDPSIEKISLQHVAESEAFRTNLGIVEAAGEPATADISVFDSEGQLLGQFSLELQAAEHRQLNRILAEQGLEGDDLRLEITRSSGEGRITAYASVVDNLTSDPRTVTPVDLPLRQPSSRLAIPGVADLDTGVASWRTDLRIFNSGEQNEDVSLIFYPQGDSESAVSTNVTVAPGEVAVIDDLLSSMFGLADVGGALHLVTEESSELVATARTYNLTSEGTYGQFIPAVSESATVGLDEAPLQLLQVEESSAFRTNIGLTEITGEPVTVRITAIVPGTLVSVSTQVSLEGYGFTQLLSPLQSLGFSSIYNARISVEVVEGDGRITAYASIVDNETQDPTYVIAQ